ncbi:MAG: hypothetical protein WAU50_06300 [Candidatus Sulfotelmatobacter sp.]
MPSEELISAASSAADHRQKSVEQARARLAIMGELHTSLLASCEALLALDLGGITRGTREQVGLSARLAREMGQENRCAVKDKPRAESGASSHETVRASALEPVRGAEMRGAAQQELKQSHQVLQALRLQSAILRRAGAKLRVLTNALAGPSANYGPPPWQSGARHRPFDGKHGGEL